MFDWSKISNWQEFQRLVNDLFFLECNSTQVMPSNPDAGIDDGFDCSYRGEYPGEPGLSGLWCIQSKWTKTRAGEAMSSLRAEVPTELEKAKTNKVNHLRIATNANLRPKHIAELEALKKRHVKTLRIWPGENLRTRILLHPYLMITYFGAAAFPKFVPPMKHFAEDQSLLAGNAKGIRSFDAYVDKAMSSVQSDGVNIFLLHASGGMGKTHLLRRIAEVATDRLRPQQVWLMRDGLRAVEDAVQTELTSTREYLLLVDDADRKLQEIATLLPFVRNANIKVLLAFRSAGRFRMDEIISQAGLENMVHRVEMLPWKREELVALLRHSAGKKTVHNEESIVAAYRSPYIISWVGQHLDRTSTDDISHLKKKLVGGVKRDTRTCLKKAGEKLDIDKFLLHLACLTPLSKREERLVGPFSNKFGLAKETFGEICSRLVAAGVLQIVGERLRFDPDMKGDLLLSDAMVTLESAELQEILDTYLAVAGDRFVVNIEAAIRFGDSPIVRDRLGDLVRSWTQSAGETSRFAKEDRLKDAEHLCGVVPDECLNLIAEYLHLEKKSPRKTSRRRPLSAEPISRDTYGPLILKLAARKVTREDILDIIEAVIHKELPGAFSNYTPEALAATCVSPLHNRAPAIHEVLGVFSSWLSDMNVPRTKLISAALTELLARSHQYTESIIKGIRIGSQALNDTPEVRVLRNAALDIFREMLNHSSIDVRLAAVKVARDHGKSINGPGLQGEVPLDTRIDDERRELAAALGKVMNETSEDVLRSEIETVLLCWWGAKTKRSAYVSKYLARLERSPEYLFLRHLITPRHLVSDFRALRKNAPRKNRWQWYVRKVMHPDTESTYEEIASELAGRICTGEDVVRFLLETEKAISCVESEERPIALYYWAKRRPHLFASLRGNSARWGRIPERYKHQIDFALAHSNKRHLATLAEEVLAKLPNVPEELLERFLTIMTGATVSPHLASAWLQQLACGGNAKTRRAVARYSWHILYHEDSIASLVQLLVEIAHRESSFDRLLDSFGLALHRIEENTSRMPGPLLNEFRHLLGKKLKTVKNFDYHADKLTRFVCENIQQVCTITEHRLKRYERSWRTRTGTSGWQLVPHPRMECVTSHINNINDFTRFADWLIKNGRKEYSFARTALKEVGIGLFSQGEEKCERALDWLRTYIAKKLAKNRLLDAVQVCHFVPLDEESLSLFLEVATRVNESEAWPALEGLLRSNVLPNEGWCSSLGEEPPELVRRKNLFLDMASQVPAGKLRTIFRDCAKSLDSHILISQRRDEEFSSPRG